MYQGDIFRTADLPLAAVLVASGFVVEGVAPGQRRGSKDFLWEATPELQATVNAWFNKTLRMEPSALFDAHRALKQRLYAEDHGTF